ncbi:hypothetical protein IV48_GL001103 [Fructilactobacillus fructivorans]|nr:hypothetical protein IV37_GL000716 [Fructilactobacillus fructivorans]KRN41327.1 hypothetical protein IV51_GL000648 [Fructilactobacillus fructivorans]KRN42875.1 hypothetical protein IV48_GL001103 [Fructilactobacillus fructivorans]
MICCNVLVAYVYLSHYLRNNKCIGKFFLSINLAWPNENTKELLSITNDYNMSRLKVRKIEHDYLQNCYLKSQNVINGIQSCLFLFVFLASMLEPYSRSENVIVTMFVYLITISVGLQLYKYYLGKVFDNMVNLHKYTTHPGLYFKGVVLFSVIVGILLGGFYLFLKPNVCYETLRSISHLLLIMFLYIVNLSFLVVMITCICIQVIEFRYSIDDDLYVKKSKWTRDKR